MKPYCSLINLQRAIQKRTLPYRVHVQAPLSRQEAYADDEIDLTDDSEMTISQELESLQNNTSNNELQFPTHLYDRTASEWLDKLPYGIDGLKLYKIKCSQQEWVQKSQDLRYFKMHTSRRKDLTGTRRVGRCIGNLLSLWWLPI